MVGCEHPSHPVGASCVFVVGDDICFAGDGLLWDFLLTFCDEEGVDGRG